MPKKHLSLTKEHKKFTPSQLKRYLIKAEGLGFDAQNVADRHGNLPAFEVLFEGTFERAKPGFWSGYYWDKVADYRSDDSVGCWLKLWVMLCARCASSLPGID